MPKTAEAPSAAAGDWVCGDAGCGNVNYSRRSACNRCGRRRAPERQERPSRGVEIGKNAAEKSRGLFSADDWQCSKCCNVNWARRLTCNVCNAPKFGEQVEARTGYGGGYDERGTVEYRKRPDSDSDDYDEFGRVKKRKVRGGLSSAPRPTLPAEPAERRAARSSDSAPPAIIMENRVTSTNDVKYRFRGRTADDSFEVTYTLQERVRAAAWAIVYENCKTSADKFESAFDKPAPDFRTIFSWRQRLLSGGCLVDGHSAPSESTERERSRGRRKRRRRYFRRTPSDESSDGRAPPGLLARLGSASQLSDSERASSHPNESNESRYRSSTSGAKRRRSDTPEIVNVRADLARAESRSPADERTSPDPSAKATSFLTPEAPKYTKQNVETPKACLPKGMLEDIVSESERYSSDGDSDAVSYVDRHKKFDACRTDDVDFSTGKIINTQTLPLPEFKHQRLEPPASENVRDDDTKKLCYAMKRIIDDMSNRIEEKGNKNLEYVPTKIDPVMAKKNHQLFKNILDIWPNDAPIAVADPERKSDTKEPTVNLDADYAVEDDALYRMDPSDRKSDDEILHTPPRAPNIGSISVNGGDNGGIRNTDDVNALLQFNLSSINTSELVSALKSIQSMSTQNESHKRHGDDENLNRNKKSDNIPFLDDIFYSSSPREDFNSETILVNETKINNPQRVILDDLGETVNVKKTCPVIGSFKSFAIPKPILLNRLRNMSQQNDPNVHNSGEKKLKAKKSSKEDNGCKKDSKKTDKDNDEESEEEGDLSKYDLWGSEDEGGDKNKKETEKDSQSQKPTEKATISDSSKKSNPKTPEKKRRKSADSDSHSSRRSSSSSSSSGSSGRTPRNCYDDFILNSEHSRAGSRDGSSSARSRSPIYSKGRSKDKRKSRSRDRNKDKSRGRDKDVKRRSSNSSRDRGRDRDRDRQRRHGSYVRGRAR